jgi:hypothetical protein
MLKTKPFLSHSHVEHAHGEIENINVREDFVINKKKEWNTGLFDETKKGHWVSAFEIFFVGGVNCVDGASR